MFRIIDKEGEEHIFCTESTFEFGQGDYYFLSRKFNTFIFIEHFEAYRFVEDEYTFCLFTSDALKIPSFCIGNKHLGHDGHFYCTITFQKFGLY